MIKIVIVDDSLLFQNILTEVIEKSGRVKVVGKAKNGQEALEVVGAVRPDLVVLDCEMPVMDGLECLKRLKKTNPVPVFMLSALTQEGADVTIKALEAGAVDFFPKPKKGVRELAHIADALVERFEAVAAKRVERYRGPAVSPGDRALVAGRPGTIGIIAIGSSTGGIQAIKEIIPKLPAKVPPIVWAQHIPEAFSTSLAQRMDSLSALTVKEARNGDRLERGTCYLAPGGSHMRLEREGGELLLKVYSDDKSAPYCPSCNILFSSVARYFGAGSMGIILTGMGSDGAAGLGEMHSQGALTIGQNEASCVVYGMPKAAFKRGAVDIEMDAGKMAEWIKTCAG